MNNRNYPHPYDFDGHPSFLDLAILSQAAYTERSTQDWVQFQPEWRRKWADWGDWSAEMVDFRGACYFKVGDDGKIVHFVLAIGGTDPTKVFDLVNDGFIAVGKVTPMLKLTIAWARWMVEKFKYSFGQDVFKTAHGTITGHSLGAYLAQMAFLTDHGLGTFENRPLVNYIGFECPGVYDSLVAMYGSKHEAMVVTNNFYAFCKTVKTAPNAINSCQEAFGKVYYTHPRFQIEFNDFYVPYPVPLSPLSNMHYYLIDYTVFVHGIDEIIKSLTRMEPISDFTYRRKTGLFGGYYEFVNYLFCPFQNDFWSLYSENLWNQNKVNKAFYKNDFLRFQSELQKQLGDAMTYCQDTPKYSANKMTLFSAKNDKIIIHQSPEKERDESMSCTIS